MEPMSELLPSYQVVIGKGEVAMANGRDAMANRIPCPFVYTNNDHLVHTRKREHYEECIGAKKHRLL